MAVLLGALAGLIAGVAELALAQALLYPALRRRHEKDKVTGRHGLDPNWFMLAIRLQSLVLLPVLGALAGAGLWGGGGR